MKAQYLRLTLNLRDEYNEASSEAASLMLEESRAASRRRMCCTGHAMLQFEFRVRFSKLFHSENRAKNSVGFFVKEVSS